MNFINNAEMAALVPEGFAKQEITSAESNGTTTTTIYGGKPNINDPSASTDDRTDWKIRRTVVVEDSTTTTVTVTWAEGSWTDRATLTYKYL